MATDLQTPRYEAIVEDNIAQVRSKIRLADLGRGVLAIACLLLGYALFVGVLDLGMGGSDGWAPLTVRLVAFLGMLVGVGVLAIQVVGRFVANVNPYYAARRLEESIPDSKNSIINWLDLKDAELPAAIHQAVGQKAARDLKDADPDLVAAPRDRWKLAASTMAFVVGLIGLFIVPHQFGTLMARAFVPLSSSTFAPATTIEILKPKSGDVPGNQRVDFLAKIVGRVPPANSPGAPTLHYRHTKSDGAVHVPLEEDNNGHWGARLSLDQLRTGVYWTITAGDASTPEMELRVRALPFVTRFEATYKFRPYRKLTPYTVKMPSDSMPTRLFGHRGTSVVLRAFTNVPVKSGQLELNLGGHKRTLPADIADPQTLVFRLPLEKSGTFRIAFESADGEKNHDRSPYALDVFEDGAPTVELVKPGKDLVAPPGGTVLVAGVAMDDFGIVSLALQLSKKSKAGEVVRGTIPYVPQTKLRFDDGAYPARVEYVEALLLDGVKDGDEITYWLEATDNNDVGGANVGKSREFKITIQDGLKPKTQQQIERQEIQKTKKDHDKAQADKHQQENKDHGKGEKDQPGGESGNPDDSTKDDKGKGDNNGNGSKDGPKEGGKDDNQSGPGGSKGDPNPNRNPKKDDSKSGDGGSPNNEKGEGAGGKGQPSPDDFKKQSLQNEMAKVADQINKALGKSDPAKESVPNPSDGNSNDQQPKDKTGDGSGSSKEQKAPSDGGKKDAPKSGDPGKEKKTPSQSGGGDGSAKEEKGGEPGAEKDGSPGKSAKEEKSSPGEGAKDLKDAKKGAGPGSDGGADSGKKSDAPAEKKGQEAAPGQGDGKGIAKSTDKKGPIEKTEKGNAEGGKVESTDTKPQGPLTKGNGENPGKKGEKSGPPTKEEIEAVREMLKQKDPAARGAARDLKNRTQEIPDADVAKMVDDLLREAGTQSAPTKEEVDQLKDMLKKGDPKADAAAKDLVDRAEGMPNNDVRKQLEDALKDAKRQKDLDKLAGKSPMEVAPPPQKEDPKQPGNMPNAKTGPGGQGISEELKAITPEAAFARRLGELQIENLDDLKKRIGPNVLKQANVSPEEWQQFLENARQYRELTDKKRRDDLKVLPGGAGKITNQGPINVQSNPNASDPLNGAQVAPPWEFRDLQRRMTGKKTQ